jgi:uncharacterized zinc-type alcohol dehydrogenase-like protein
MKSRGYAAVEANSDLVPFEFDRRDVGPRDVAFRVLYSGICHSDIHQVREEWGPSLFPMVPGHEIIGEVTAVGSDVVKFSPGQRVGVGVFVDACRECPKCLAGLDQYCPNGTGTYNTRDRDGNIVFGGYSDTFVVDERYAVTIPDQVDMAGTAPLLCAGITLYSPLRHWGAGPGKRVGIIGLGGLGHMGVQFAHAMGAHVTVFSHSPDKEADARAMGADDFVLTLDPATLAASPGEFDLIVNSTSADIDLNPYLTKLALDGTLCVVGISGAPVSINQDILIVGRRSLAGSMIGGMAELQEMIDFAAEHQIVSLVEVVTADQINVAYDRTVASDVKYRFVIDASTF